VQTILDQQNISPKAILNDEPEFLYKLNLADLQTPPKVASGEWRGRLIKTRDIELMTQWRVGYAVELMGETESPQLWQHMRRGVEKYLQLGHAWILEDDRQPVATSAFNSKTDELVQVGGVWTPPELRGKGYGRSAVAASLLAVREEGVHTAILFTGKDNIAAQKAYEALGFYKIGDYRITVLKEPLTHII
jgi:predicted GNAT family acetyltransferase